MCTKVVHEQNENNQGLVRVGVALLNVRSGYSYPSRRDHDSDTRQAGWRTRGERARREAAASPGHEP